MTVPTVTMAISATIRLTLKTILKLLSHDMFGSVRLALPAARRASGQARPRECAFADLWIVFVRSIEHPCPKQYRSRRCISVNFGGRRNTEKQDSPATFATQRSARHGDRRARV